MVIFISSCNNEIDLLDEYRETTVIYGLLIASDSVQYLRVQKAFLGKGNALLMAQNADSIYYDTADVEISLLRYKDDLLFETIKLQPTDKLPKDDGLFINYPHTMYKTNGTQLLDEASVYKLLFHNKKSGKTIYAFSPIVKQLSLNPLIPSPLPDPSSKLNIAAKDPLKVSIISPLNGKFLSLLIRVNYTELITGTTQSQKKTLNYDLEVKVSSTTLGGEKLEYLINGEDFYRFLGGHIKNDPGLYREAAFFNLDFIFTVGAEEFYTYYIVNNTSSSVSDNIPEYTNLSGGVGIFSSRSVKIYPAKKLNDISVDSLIHGQFTSGLFH